MAKKYAPCWLDEEGLSDGLFKVLRKMAVLYQTEREILQIISLHPESVPKQHLKELELWLAVKKMTLKLKDINGQISTAKDKLEQITKDLKAVKNEKFDLFMKDLKALVVKHRCTLCADYNGAIEVSCHKWEDQFDFQEYINHIG